MRKFKKGFKRREHYYDPGKQPMPRKIVDATHAKLPEKPTRQMLRAQQRRGG